MNYFKYKIIAAGLLFMAFCNAACVKDKSVHDLFELNTITISDTTAVETLLQFDSLKISPVLTQSIPVPETELDYSWVIRNGDGYGDVITLDSTRDLNQPIGVKPGDYVIVYRVTVRSTGVSFMKHFPITIINRFSLGWLLLEDKQNVGDMSIILPTDTVFHNVFRDLNRNYELKMPLRKIATSETYSGKSIEIYSQNEAIRLDYDEMVKISSFKEWFWEAPEPVNPEQFANLSMSTNNIINNGLLHIYVAGGFPGEVKYMNALPFVGGKGDNYYLAPFIGVGPQPYTGGNTSYSALYFDKVSKGFVYLSGVSLIPQIQGFNAPGATAAFDMRNIGMDLVSMDRGYKAMFYNAIFKDNSNNQHLYQIDLNSSQPAVLKQALPAELNGADMSVSSRQLQHMYFFKGSSVYLYDIMASSASVIAAIPAGETVTKVKISTSEMQVATWTGSEGKFYTYSIGTRGELTLKKTYTGFGKIIDFVYKS